MKIQPKPNQNTSLPLTRTSSSVSSHGEEYFSKCFLSPAATRVGRLTFIFMRHMQKPPAERTSSKVVETNVCGLGYIELVPREGSENREPRSVLGENYPSERSLSSLAVGFFRTSPCKGIKLP